MAPLVTNSLRPLLAAAATVLLLAGCNGESPTAPRAQGPLPGAPMATLMGNVFGNSRACLVGAVVEVMDGARQGARWTQKECQGAWDYGDGGFWFFDLPPDTNVRVRASKEGYKSRETTVYVTRGPASYVEIVLEPE